MKFGLEAEKFIFDLRKRAPSESIFSILDAVSDVDHNINGFAGDKATNEFVLNMVEFGTTPSADPLDVLKDYLLSYLLIKDVAAREQVAIVPLASLPMDYLPHMTPKRAYYLQNSVLAGHRQQDWMMDMGSPLRAAGNCAGVHVHAEIETPKEFLFSTEELKDKFNLGLMMTPMIAFASSPYFFSRHEGKSMRGLRYYQEVYKNFPLNGGLPPMMNSSIEALEFVKKSGDRWIAEGESLGFSREEMEIQVYQKSANWNPVRWNGRWNTIEIRCIDSDFLGLDVAKFIWISTAMKRADPKGEGLRTRILKTKTQLDQKMIEECFAVSGSEIAVLPSSALQDLFERAMIFGLKDDLVNAYLYRLAAFARPALRDEAAWPFKRLFRVLETGETTSEWVLSKTQGQTELSTEESANLVLDVIEREAHDLDHLRAWVPGVFQQMGHLGDGLAFR